MNSVVIQKSVLFAQRIFTVAIPFILLGCGTVVRSRGPFYTEQSKVFIPGVCGQWELRGSFRGTSQPEMVPMLLAMWTFTQHGDEYRVKRDWLIGVENENDDVSTMVLFKIKNSLYADTLMTRGGHTVHKVELTGGQLSLCEMNWEWLRSAVTNSIAGFPNVRWEEQGSKAFVADPAEWEKLLATYGNDPKVFPPQGLTLTKTPMMNFSPTRPRSSITDTPPAATPRR